jgi:dynein heavy chain 1
VEKELSEAEPALLAAKQSVQNIRKPQLDEVRALARPPNAVRLTMEMVSIMIGEKNMEWTEIRKVIRREDFIPTVVNFDPLTLHNKQVVEVQRDYLDNPELNYDAVDRASKACGPLYEWSVSQIKYATILKKVKPLRDEVERLQEKGVELVVKQKEAIEETSELEAAIKQYKVDYAAAIRDTEIIRAEMDSVSKKVSRAEALLLSLEQEKDRWQSTSTTFDKQMSTLIGDSLLAGAFLTYAGIFDHKHRKVVWREWVDVLNLLNIPYSLGTHLPTHSLTHLLTRSPTRQRVQ